MIYFDHHATTPCDPAVVEAMTPFFTRHYGNPASQHSFGHIAADAVHQARVEVGALINGEPQDIIFTSGATESNNLAILGIARSYLQSGGTRRRLVTTPIEHKAVLAPLQQLSSEGWDLVYLPLTRDGLVDLDAANTIINSETLLVSAQAANSEIGTIQPIFELSKIARFYGAIMHCDATQAVGKIPVNVDDLGIDLLSLSAHKIYGPKGIGALWVGGNTDKLPFMPIMYGGQQLGNTNRPGTLPVPLIVGLGKACAIARSVLDDEARQSKELRDRFESLLSQGLPAIRINGAFDHRLPNNSNITFTGIDAEVLLANIPEVIASSGSACDAGSIEPSSVLLAIGLSWDQAFETLRFGLGRFTTPTEVDAAASYIIAACRKIASLDL